MKTILAIILSLLSSILLSQDLPNVDIISTRQSSVLEIKLSSDGHFDEIISSLVFTVKWDNTISEDIENINLTGQYPIYKSGDVVVNGIYSYQSFVGFGFSHMSESNSSLDPYTPYVLGFFNIDSDGLYEVINDDITNTINGDYYISLNGEDKTRDIINEITTRIHDESPIVGTNYGLYPNPFTESFEIKSDVEPNRVQILDISGKIVYESNITKDRISFDTSELLPGQYLIRIIFETKTIVLKGSKI